MRLQMKAFAVLIHLTVENHAMTGTFLIAMAVLGVARSRPAFIAREA